MRSFVAITLFVTLFVCCSDENANNSSWYQDSMRADSITSADSIAKANEELNAEKNFTSYDLNQLIRIDLDGDGSTELVDFLSPEGRIGINFYGSGSRKIMKFETTEGEIVEDFSWVDSWGLLQDSTVTVTYAVDGELLDSTFTLENPAIKLWQDGGGSGFFTFKGGKFIWVTTGC